MQMDVNDATPKLTVARVLRWKFRVSTGEVRVEGTGSRVAGTRGGVPQGVRMRSRPRERVRMRGGSVRDAGSEHVGLETGRQRFGEDQGFDDPGGDG